MDVSVRYIPQTIETTARGVIVGGNKPALCFRAAEYAHCIIYDELVIHPVRIPVREHDRSPLLDHHGQPYPVARFLDHIRAAVAAGKPVSRGTIRLLTRAGLPVDGLPVLDVPDGDTDDSSALGQRRTPPQRDGADNVQSVAAELKLPARIIRKLARRAGMSAPYNDRARLLLAVQSDRAKPKRTLRVDFSQAVKP